MTVKTLSLTNYRCFSEKKIEFSPFTNVLYGENGTGKTTVLEALGYLSTVRSFRFSKEKELIKYGEEQAKIEAECDEKTIYAGIYASQGRILKIDGNNIDAPKLFIGHLPGVVFSPEDMSLVKGGPSERRRFLDIALSQLKPRYMRELSAFRRAFEEKNKILRLINEKPVFTEVLPEYNRVIARTSAYLSQERETFLQNLNISEHHKNISGQKENILITFRTQAKSEGTYLSLMESKRHAEYTQKQCLVGAHKDDIEITINGEDIRNCGSQGQCRTTALSMKLAQRDIFVSELTTQPILLLDDVLSELDAGRQKYILNHIGGGQVFITSCERRALTKVGKNIKICLST